MIIGGLNGQSLEDWDSGAVVDTINADGDRERLVSNIYQCLKHDERTVLAAMPVHPNPLRSQGGRKANGTPGDFINWGNDFVLDDVKADEFGGSFSRIIAGYKATNPTGGVASSGVGDIDGRIIGGLHEFGRDYLESPESGETNDDRIWLADLMGWYVEREVGAIYVCAKEELRTILDAWDLTPNPLKTSGGSEPDGSVADEVNWGYGFEVIELRGDPISPSFCKLLVQHRKNIPEAAERPPDGMTIACENGICYLTWKGTLFETWDSGLGVCNEGFEFYRISDTVVQIRCNGIVFDTFEASAAGTHELKWTVNGNEAILTYCGEIWKDFIA